MTVVSTLAKWVGIVCVPLVLTVPVIACSRAFPTYKVGSDFVVSVADRGKPLSGIEVHVAREVAKPEFHFETVFWNITDQKGEMAIRGLSVGRYFITISHAEVESENAGELDVESESPLTQSRLSFEWPGHVIFSLQTIAGVLAADKERLPVSGAVALLVDAVSGQQVGATVADEKGRFEFRGWADPGLYILRMSAQGLEKRPGTQLRGNIFIQLDPGAKDKELPRLGLVMSSCGLGAYKEDNRSMVIF